MQHMADTQRHKSQLQRVSRRGDVAWTYREVGGELGSDDSVGAVVASDLAPHDAELASLGLVDVGDLLSVVEVASLLVLNTLDLDKTGLVVCVATSSVITKNNN